MKSKTYAIDIDTALQAAQMFYRQSLFATAIDLCGYKELTWRTHGSCITALESDSKRKLIVMPRGTFKTSLAVVAYSIWQMIRNPNIRILIDSELWTLSRNSLREIKGHLQSEAFQRVFPGWELSLSNQAEIIINQRTVTKKEPTITGSGLGAGKTGRHFDLVIADDLNSPLNSLKPELAVQVIDHYRYYTSLLDPGGTIVIIGTRYSEHDLIGFILKNEMDDADGRTVKV